MFDSDRLERLDSEQRNIIKTQGKVKFEKGRDVLNPEAESLEEARQAHFMRVQCAPPPPSTPNAIILPQPKSVGVPPGDLIFFCHSFRAFKLACKFVLFKIRTRNRLSQLGF